MAYFLNLTISYDIKILTALNPLFTFQDLQAFTNLVDSPATEESRFLLENYSSKEDVPRDPCLDHTSRRAESVNLFAACLP